MEFENWQTPDLLKLNQKVKEFLLYLESEIWEKMNYYP